MKVLSSCLSFALMLGSTASAQQTPGPVPSRITAPVDESHLVTLKGNLQALAGAQFDRGLAPPAMPTGRIRLILSRSAEQQQALSTLLVNLQNPASLSWHKWLTPAEFGADFGISESDLQQVQLWLQSHGLKIESVSPARNVIEFSGSVGQLKGAFHTSIHSFAIDGQTHFANITDPQIPAALAPVIAAVGPLTDFHPRPAYVRGTSGVFDPSQHRIVPSLTLTSNGTPYLFVDPADAATIYDTPNKYLNPSYTGSTSYDGSGVTIGIAGTSDLTTADVANYRAAFLGESTASANLPAVIVDGNDPGLNGAGVEALLDTEISGGIAPKAKIIFYTSADTDLSSGLFNAIFRALDDNAVSILSVSFQNCESSLGASGNQLVLEAAEQAAAQGITLVASAGDNGSAGCDDFDTQTQANQGFAVNGLASTPYNIAVGGTDFDVLQNSFSQYINNTSNGAAPYYLTALKYIPEMPWNDSTTRQGPLTGNLPWSTASEQNIDAGSGGVSTVYSKPPFQTSLTPNDNARDLPDVSLLAGNGLYQAVWAVCSDGTTDGSPTGVDCQTNNGQFTSNTTFSGVGGTSAAAPAFAGMLALLAQAHGSPSDNYRLGQADNVLYQLAQSHYANVFHDVTSGNNSVACASGSPDCGSNGFMTGYNAVAGYDLASGLGSVDVAAMVANWNSVSPASTSTTFSINGSTAPYTGTHGASLTFNVDVAPSSATGVAAIVDSANQISGGIQNNGQFAIPIASGSGSATYNGLPGGSYTVWARYGGDTANASSVSTPPINVTIAPEDSSTALAVHAYDRTTGQPISTTNVPLGAYVFLDAQIEGTAEGANSQGIATGSVTFTDGSPILGVAPVSSGNQASWPPRAGNLPVLGGGQHQLAASYSGDASYKASSSTVSLNVLPGSSQVKVDSEDIPSLTLTSSQSNYVQTTVYTDNFGTASPTGTVSLLQNNTVVSSGSVGGGDGGSQWVMDGLIPIKASQLQPGLNTFTVQYSGDSNYAPSSSGPVSIDAIAPGGGLTLTSPDTLSMSAGGSLTKAITLTPSGGYTGLVQWSCLDPANQNVISCLVPETHVPLSGPVDTPLVIFASSSTPSGNYTITLNGYDGSATDGITISKNITVNVTTTPPALAVMSNGLLNVTAGSTSGNVSDFSIIPSGGLTGQVNLSCTVATLITDPQSAPTCTVPASLTLKDASPIMAQVQIGTTSSTTPGSYSISITATSASQTSITTSGTVSLTVTASPSFSLSTTGIVNILVGTNSSNAATLTITPLNGFSGSVAVNCFVRAAYIAAGSTVPTCTVPSSVDLSSGIPATVNVGLSTPVQNFGGFYLMTLSVVDRNSAELGFDATVNVMMGAAPSFSLNSSGNIQVNPGATMGNTSTINVAPANGFTGGVNLTCSVSAAMPGATDEPGCSLNPSAVNIGGTVAVTSTLTISTTASTSGAVVPSARHFGSRATVVVLAFVFLFGIGVKRRNWIRILGVLLLAIWIGPIACGGGGGGAGSGGGSGGGGGGGGGGSTGTTIGQYNVIVTGTDSATGKISSQVNVALTVQ